jgi:PPOX class probable F420-dependent enzyme
MERVDSRRMTTPAEITAFLERAHPPLLGVVSSLLSDGRPHVVPVWYRWDGERIHIWTHHERLWARNVRRDPRVAFSVQESWQPFAAVTMRGHAELEFDDPGEVRRITERYIHADDVEAYIARFPTLRALVRIRPEQVGGWKRGY